MSNINNNTTNLENILNDINNIPVIDQATPSISVSSAGLITASVTQGKGYIESGTKSATKQLTTKSTTTYTPTTSNQTIASGTYLIGTQTIKGDSNLIAANIASGKSIFGVSGSFAGAPTLLWTNASPTSEFAAQTITLPSGYSAFLVEVRYSLNNASTKFCYLAIYSNIQLLWVIIDSGATQRRGVQKVTSTSIVFDDSGTNAVPVNIYGVKWSM